MAFSIPHVAPARGFHRYQFAVPIHAYIVAGPVLLFCGLNVFMLNTRRTILATDGQRVVSAEGVHYQDLICH